MQIMEVIMKELIDVDSWDRKRQYLFFSGFTNPYSSCSLIIDVDNIVNYSKNNNLSFYCLLSFLVLKTINEIDAFKYVLEEGKVYKYSKINTSISVLDATNQINFSKTIEYNDFKSFYYEFSEKKKEAENNKILKYDNDYNKCYITCAPWMRVTSVANPMNYSIVDSIPRIFWGKYFIENDHYMIDLSIQFNHAFQDGYHIGLFQNNLQKNIDLFTGE